MAAATPGKRELNSARTRERLIDAAVELYGDRSIDDVSLREISVAAGQRNPNALQYHFSDRDGLLQAIVDKHATEIGNLRQAYVQRATEGEWSQGEAAARCLVMPIIDYVEATSDGVNFVKVVSQIAAVYQNGTVSGPAARIQFPRSKALENVFNQALSALPPREAQRRIYLVVNITFHSIADIYRASLQQPTGSPIATKKPMLEQLICLIESYLSAPAQGME